MARLTARAKRPTRASKPTRTKARKAKPSPSRPKVGPLGIRTAPRGDRFYPAEHALRKYALAKPEATEDYPWGHRAFRVNKKVFLFLAWDDGVFSFTAKIPRSQAVALMLPFAEPTGYGMGRTGWVTARFSGRAKVPVGTLCQWIDESHITVATRKVPRTRGTRG